MKLYRGDNIFNEKTNPKLYRNNGFRSKAFGSGCDPSNIEVMGLLESIRKHIKPDGITDYKYYNVTDFLSFSESQERALFWCRDQDTLTMERAKDYEETRYLFTLVIDENWLTHYSDGLYLYRYCCNPRSKTSDTTASSLLNLIHLNEICPQCENCNKNHKILLFNTLEYLTANIGHEKFQGALENATKDLEWLILPFDPLGMGHRSARIPRADFWYADLYKVNGEERP